MQIMMPLNQRRQTAVFISFFAWIAILGIVIALMFHRGNSNAFEIIILACAVAAIILGVTAKISGKLSFNLILSLLGLMALGISVIVPEPVDSICRYIGIALIVGSLVPGWIRVLSATRR